MKRIFVAIDISAEARQKTADYLEGLRRRFPRLRVGWERPEKLHLTLIFLGDTDEGKITEVENAVKRIADSVSAFHISIGGTGVFPGKRDARILWIGVLDNGELNEIATKLETECRQLGFEPEKRKFNPHLTIARLREPKLSKTLASSHAANEFEPVGFEVREIVIYESKLLLTGSVYTKIASFPFR